MHIFYFFYQLNFEQFQGILGSKCYHLPPENENTDETMGVGILFKFEAYEKSLNISQIKEERRSTLGLINSCKDAFY